MIITSRYNYVGDEAATNAAFDEMVSSNPETWVGSSTAITFSKAGKSLTVIIHPISFLKFRGPQLIWLDFLQISVSDVSRSRFLSLRNVSWDSLMSPKPISSQSMTTMRRVCPPLWLDSTRQAGNHAPFLSRKSTFGEFVVIWWRGTWKDINYRGY